MAIEGKDNPSQVRDAMRRAQEQSSERAQRPDTSAPEERQSRRDESRRSSQNYASLAEIGRKNPMPLAMSNTAEALEQFRKDFVEMMPSKDDNNMLVVNVFPIDSSVANIPFSCLVVAGLKRGKENLGVGYHTFILAGSANTIHPREESIRGQRATIVQVAGDGYDSRMRDVVKEVLGSFYRDKTLISSDAEVIYEGFPTAKDDPQAIADAVKNAFAAIKTAIDRVDPEAPQLRLSNEDNNSYNTIHVQHRQNHIYDRGHMPIRADVIIDLQARENRGRNSRDPIDQLVTGTRISRVGGFFDFVYAPADGAVSRNDLFSRRSDRRGEEYQMYALRFITTFVDTVDFSPTTMLLAHATANAIGESNEVMRAFEPNTAVGEDDMRNIGALAIEPNLQEMERGFGERWETKSPQFTPAKRQALLRATVRPGLIQSIDVPECGSATWQYVDLLAVADGSQAAMNRYYDTACILTNGHFEDLYGRNDPIIDSHIERIHGGYYTENDRGQRLDLRDIDYLAILNLLRPEVESDLIEIQKWGMAASSNEDSILSQSDRFEIIKAFVPSAVVTHYYQRMNFASSFQDAFMEAIARCKLSLNPSSSSRDGVERYRSTYGNIDQILNRPGSGGLYRNQRSNREFDRDRYYERSDRNDNRW